MGKAITIIIMICFLGFAGKLYSQELEPRLLTNVPVGTNFLVGGYSYTSGSILLDPSLPIEDLNGKVHAGAIAYVRSIKLFGQSGKLNLIIPYAEGNWSGIVDGIDSTRQTGGLGDIRARFAFNFHGSPALKKEDLKDYQQNIISGASIQVIIPTGNYENDKVINIGSNRLTLKSVVGASKKAGPWIIEFYTSIWIFLANDDFLEGNKLTQSPLGAVKVHFIRTLPRGNWVTFDLGYGYGGRTYINDEPRDVRISTFRFGFTVAIPFAKKHNLRVTGISGRRLERGPDFDGFGTYYQYRWIKNDN